MNNLNGLKRNLTTIIQWDHRSNYHCNNSVACLSNFLFINFNGSVLSLRGSLHSLNCSIFIIESGLFFLFKYIFNEKASNSIVPIYILISVRSSIDDCNGPLRNTCISATRRCAQVINKPLQKKFISILLMKAECFYVQLCFCISSIAYGKNF